LITLDTNIYVSALQFGGKPMEVLQQALNGELEIAVSAAILDETMRVLREKFAWLDADLEAGRALILTCAHLVEPKRTIDVITEDPTDNRILECAAEGGAECIVTGDRHLLRLGKYAEIRIVLVAEFLQGS
jgi:uncharacterized protein